MLTYTPPEQSPMPRPTEKPWLLLLLCFVWLWPGIIGHAPWYADEPQVMSVLAAWRAQETSWWLPVLAGEPHLQYSPFYYFLPYVLAQLFSPWLLSFHDAARLSTPIFMSLALWCLGLVGRDLIGKRHGRSAVLIMIGSLGLLSLGHELTPAAALFFAYCLSFYAFSLSIRPNFLAGFVLACAFFCLFAFGSLFALALVWMVALMLPAFSAWRHLAYVKTLLIAHVLALPFALFWPLLLAKHDPLLLGIWWRHFAFAAFSGGQIADLWAHLWFYFKILPWFTWPAWPLALWALWVRRARLNLPLTQLCLLFFAVLSLMLLWQPMPHAHFLSPILLPLVLLAACELDSLRRGAAAFLNWFGLMTFGLLGVFLWLGWSAMNFAWPQKLAERSRFFSPTYEPQLDFLLLILAILASATWLWAVTRRHVRGRQAVTNWAAGATLVWSLAMTLWLPWFDAQQRYREAAQAMRSALPADFDCVAVEKSDLLARAVWHYDADLRLKPDGVCAYRLLRERLREPKKHPHWQDIWRGHRGGERHEIYILQRRKS